MSDPDATALRLRYAAALARMCAEYQHLSQLERRAMQRMAAWLEAEADVSLELGTAGAHLEAETVADIVIEGVTDAL
jgi:hypothetical protein